MCPVKNEESGLREAMLSILSQTHKNLILHVVDNSSDDDSLKIAKSVAQSDSRVFVSKTNESLSVNRSWEFSLRTSLEGFQFDYLMFFGGDDRLPDVSFLSSLINQMQIRTSLMGVVPEFIDQYGYTKIEIKLRKLGNYNRYKLSQNWGYVHSIYGLYKRDCWEEIFTFHKETFDKGVEFDWWLAINLFKFPVVQVKSAHYLKFSKLIPYDSEYYSSVDYSRDEGRRNFQTNKNAFSGVLSPLIDLIVLVDKTKSHFKGQPNFKSRNSKLLIFNVKVIFFAAGLSSIVRSYYLVFKGKLHLRN